MTLIVLVGFISLDFPFLIIPFSPFIQAILTLDEVVTVVTHEEAPPMVKAAYMNFLNNCFFETEAEVKEIHHSIHIWRLFEAHLLDMQRFCSPEYDLGMDSFNSYVGDTLMLSMRLFFSQYNTNPGLVLPDNRKNTVVSLLEAACDVGGRLQTKAIPCGGVIATVRTLLTLATDRSFGVRTDLASRAEDLLVERTISAGECYVLEVSCS